MTILLDKHTSIDARGRKYTHKKVLVKARDGLTDAFDGFVTEDIKVHSFRTIVFGIQIAFADATSVEATVEISQDEGITWAPWPDTSTASGSTYTEKTRIDQYLAADQAALTGGIEGLIGTLTDANMNSTSDQEIEFDFADLDAAYAIYQIQRITASGASTSLTNADGGVYPEAAKAGTAIVDAAQVYTDLVNPEDTLDLTIANPEIAFGQDSIFLSLTGAQGGAATADFEVYAVPAPMHELAFELDNVGWIRIKLKHTGGTDDLPQAQVFITGGR